LEKCLVNCYMQIGKSLPKIGDESFQFRQIVGFNRTITIEIGCTVAEASHSLRSAALSGAANRNVGEPRGHVLTRGSASWSFS